MSIEPGLLRYALHLFAIELPEGQDPDSLAEVLGVTEEILPWIVLKSGLFDTQNNLGQALRAAAAASPRAATARAPAQTPSLTLDKAVRDLDWAVEALIRDDIANEDLANAADARLAALTRLSAGTASRPPQHQVPVELPLPRKPS